MMPDSTTDHHDTSLSGLSQVERDLAELMALSLSDLDSRSDNSSPEAKIMRIQGIDALISRVQSLGIGADAGLPRGFHAPAWVALWVGEPHPELGGACPFDLLGTPDGQARVLAVLEHTQDFAG